MKGIVLAGGHATRLRPVTNITNKQLLPIYNKPLVYYPILTLKDAGIKEILVISGPGHAGQLLDQLRNGKELGVDLVYDIQEEPKGLAHGLNMAKDFADNEGIAMILGDNIFGDSLKKAVDDFKKQEKGGKITIKKVHDPERFGVVKFNRKGDKIAKVIEKPKNPPTNWMIPGFYMFDNRVFDVYKTIKPSKRGEYEITSLINFYVRENTMTYHKLKSKWIDAGTFDSLLEANNFIAKKQDKLKQFMLK